MNSLQQPKSVRPLVSILIPAYNADRWIRQTIQSALDQTYEPKEIIVVDDGSTDRTLEAIREFGGRIRLAEGPHAGGNAARNRLLELSAGEWVQFLDADDCLLPDKIIGQVEHAASQDSPVDIVYSPVILWHDSSGAQTPIVIDPQADAVEHYIGWGAFCTSGLLFRRSAVIDAGRWKESQPACQEHELLLRFLQGGKRFGLWNQPATLYRDHGTATVSKRNPLRTIRLRMELTDRLEQYLQTTNRLTAAHKKALYIARMESARTAWDKDRSYSQELFRKAKSAGRWWVRTSPALPPHFQLTSFLFGFDQAERLAQLQRRLQGRAEA